MLMSFPSTKDMKVAVTYVRFIPLTERSCINLDDGTLDKGISSDELIVGGVINLNGNISLIRFFGPKYHSRRR